MCNEINYKFAILVFPSCKILDKLSYVLNCVLLSLPKKETWPIHSVTFQ